MYKIHHWSQRFAFFPKTCEDTLCMSHNVISFRCSILAETWSSVYSFASADISTPFSKSTSVSTHSVLTLNNDTICMATAFNVAKKKYQLYQNEDKRISKSCRQMPDRHCWGNKRLSCCQTFYEIIYRQKDYATFSKIYVEQIYSNVIWPII